MSTNINYQSLKIVRYDVKISLSRHVCSLEHMKIYSSKFVCGLSVCVPNSTRLLATTNQIKPARRFSETGMLSQILPQKFRNKSRTFIEGIL
jgi:hypothetical protein